MGEARVRVAWSSCSCCAGRRSKSFECNQVGVSLLGVIKYIPSYPVFGRDAQTGVHLRGSNSRTLCPSTSYLHSLVWLTHILQDTLRLVQESSVEKFGAVHAKLTKGHINEEETTRGASRRELQRFFTEHDKNEGYASLRRIADEDGTAVWTILKETEVTEKLEERTKERKQEERRHDEIFSAQARAPLGTTGAAWKEAEAGLRAELKAETMNEGPREPQAEAEKARGEAELKEIKLQIEGKAGCCSIF